MCYALIKQDCKYMYALLLMLFYWNFFGHSFVINFIFISENMTCNSGKGSVDWKLHDEIWNQNT